MKSKNLQFQTLRLCTIARFSWPHTRRLKCNGSTTRRRRHLRLLLLLVEEGLVGVTVGDDGSHVVIGWVVVGLRMVVIVASLHVVEISLGLNFGQCTYWLQKSFKLIKLRVIVVVFWSFKMGALILRYCFLVRFFVRIFLIVWPLTCNRILDRFRLEAQVFTVFSIMLCISLHPVKYSIQTMNILQSIWIKMLKASFKPMISCCRSLNTPSLYNVTWIKYLGGNVYVVFKTHKRGVSSFETYFIVWNRDDFGLYQWVAWRETRWRRKDNSLGLGASHHVTYSQFHQHFTISFWADILVPKNYRA